MNINEQQIYRFSHNKLIQELVKRNLPTKFVIQIVIGMNIIFYNF